MREPQAPERVEAALIGALPGEGIGPEVVEGALEALRCLERAGGRAVRAFIDRYKRLLADVHAQPDRPLRDLLPSRPGRFSRLLRRVRTP